MVVVLITYLEFCLIYQEWLPFPTVDDPHWKERIFIWLVLGGINTIIGKLIPKEQPNDR